ncbi:MAG: TraR/DksA family transcriptional regulator [Gemmatimonadota bacterium]|nr:TraR/DksA family transcriptional regulator [Gemmatimonadota bacterium]MDH3428201.1 TraR/DksA family transcriptional regulator [Gemmatimonadota bacterium]
MDEQQLAELRATLAAELTRLEQSMNTTAEGLKPVELDQTAVGRLSRMDELQNQAMTRNLHERQEMKLAGLTQALNRIEDGTYGTCTECGGEIPLARLEVFPETATCMECTA